MEDRIQVSEEQLMACFAASYIEGLALQKGKPYQEVLNEINYEKVLKLYEQDKETWRHLDYNRINDPSYQPRIKFLTQALTIGGTVYDLSQRLDAPLATMLRLFYRSKTCTQLHDKKTGLYLMSNGYIADDFIYEMQRG